MASSSWETNHSSGYGDHGAEIFHNYTKLTLTKSSQCVQNGVYSELECMKRVTRELHVSNTCVPLRVGEGMYHNYIVEWLSVIPKERFLFLRSEDLRRDPYLVQKAWQFIGLDPVEERSILKELNNEYLNRSFLYSKLHMLPETQDLLKTFYQPYNKKLANLLGDDRFLWLD